MRLSEWRAAAPIKEAVAPRVIGVLESVLGALGTEADPYCWIIWGEEPANRYWLLAPTLAGLVTAHVRVNVPGEGPRASGKLVRWSRVQIADLAVETIGGHRLVSTQLEGQVLKGVDAYADMIGAFLQVVMAMVDGRPAPVASVWRSDQATGPRGPSGQGPAAPSPGAARGPSRGTPAVPLQLPAPSRPAARKAGPRRRPRSSSE